MLTINSVHDPLTLARAISLVEQSLYESIDEDSMDVAFQANGLRVTFFDHLGAPSMQPVKFFVTDLESFQNEPGIHLFPDGFDRDMLISDLRYRLADSINQCERDGFQCVYIHLNVRG